MKTTTNYGGIQSEWSEAALKMIRLHEIQQLINEYKTNPSQIQFGIPNYIAWFQQCKNLRGEGYSKYSKEEQKEIDEMQALIERVIKVNPAHVQRYSEGYEGQTKSFALEVNNYERLIKMIQIFEDKIKYYNDIHGLTTKNYDPDLEGL